MKTKIRLLTFFFIGCTVGWVASSIYFKEVSERRFPSPMERPPKGSPFEQLNLDDEIKSKIDSIHRGGRRQFMHLDAKVRSSKKEFDELLSQTKDQKKLKEAFSKFINAKAEIEWGHFKHMQEIHSLLSIEQIKKLQEGRPKPVEGRRPLHMPGREGRGFAPGRPFEGDHRR